MVQILLRQSLKVAVVQRLEQYSIKFHSYRYVWLLNLCKWRGGRAVDCGGLENHWGVTAPGGSNPSPSALPP